MSYEKVCEQIKSEVKLLSDQELKAKIISWRLNSELEIYVNILEEEFNYRN
jgi:hypothetical protein